MANEEKLKLRDTQLKLPLPGPEVKRGWLCPNCSKVHGPHVSTCPEQTKKDRLV